MWTETLKRHGVDYSSVDIPNCEYKVSHSLEMGFNHTTTDDGSIDHITEAFLKVEANLTQLREWERSR